MAAFARLKRIMPMKGWSMDSRPKVSVIIPAYNALEVLPRCVQSVLGQTLDEIEVVIVNDGSTDGSLAVLDGYSDSDKRVRVIHKENGGVSAARNDGLRFAKGEYVFFCDADDWLEPTALEELYVRAVQSGSDIVCFDFFRENPERNSVQRLFPSPFSTDDEFSIMQIRKSLFYCGKLNLKCNEFDRVLYLGGSAWHHLILRDLIETDEVRFDERLAIFEDGLFMFQVFAKAKKVSLSPKGVLPLPHFRRFFHPWL